MNSNKKYSQFCKDIGCPEYKEKVYLRKENDDFLCSGFKFCCYCLVLDKKGKMSIDFASCKCLKFNVDELKVLCAKIKHKI